MHVYVQIAHCLPRDTHLASNALVYTNAENRSDFHDREAPVLLVEAMPQTLIDRRLLLRLRTVPALTFAL